MLNVDISYNGQDLFHMGHATAHSGTNNLAIASGDGSTADAGYGETTGGLSLVGQHDSAFAYGADSTAIAGGGDSDSATATDGGTAYSGLFEAAGVSSTGATGATATASDGATADSGFTYIADVFGNNSTAMAGGTSDVPIGDNDLAAVFGSDLSALAGPASGMTDIEPSSFADLAPLLTPSDDFGLSNLLADLSAIGL